MAQQQIAKLANERDRLGNEINSLNTQLDLLTKQQTEATTAIAATQQQNEALSKTNQQLQSQMITAQEAADRAFSRVVDATSRLHDAKIKIDNQLERLNQLNNQVSDMSTVMRRSGLNPNSRPGDIKPTVDGFVSYIQRRAGAEQIELTIGSDDGLERGHTVEIFRNDKYLGRAEVLSTNPDKSIARILPEYKRYRIQEGDRVATRLN